MQDLSEIESGNREQVPTWRIRPLRSEKSEDDSIGVMCTITRRVGITNSKRNYKRDNEKGFWVHPKDPIALTLIAILEVLRQTARFFVAEATVIHGPTVATPHVMDMQQPQFVEPRKKFGQPLPHRRHEFTIVAPPS